MPNIEKRVLKGGTLSYRVTVMFQGKRYRKSFRFTASMSEKQADKEVHRLAEDLKESLFRGLRPDDKITLAEWIDVCISEKQSLGRKKKTISDYIFCSRRVNDFFGNTRLTAITPTDITKFFIWLSKQPRATCDRAIKRNGVDLDSSIRDFGLSHTKLSSVAQISVSSVCNAVRGERILYTVANKIAVALSQSTDELFDIIPSVTPISHATQQSYRRFLSLIFSAAHRKRLIPENPFDYIEGYSRPTKEKFSLQPYEIRKIL